MESKPPRRPLWPAAIATGLILSGFAYLFGSTAAAPPIAVPPTIPELAAPAPSTTSTTSTTAANIPPAEVPPGWTLLPPGPLDPRIGHSSVWTGEALFVWGGRSLLTKHSTGAIYTPEGNTWSEMPRAPIAGGSRQALAWTSGEVIAFSSAAAVFDPVRERWGKLSWDDPIDTVMTATATGSDVMIVNRPSGVGGEGLSAARYVPGEPCCETLPAPPIDLSYGSLFWTGTEFLLIGGAGAPQPGDASPRFASFDPTAGTWDTLETPPLKIDGPITTSWTGSKLVSVDYLMRTTVWEEATGWVRLPDAPFEYHGCIPRSAALPDDIVFTWYCRQAAILDLTAGEWTAIAVPELDPHAVSTSCLPVPAGTRVLMWCGNDPASPMFWEIAPEMAIPVSEWQNRTEP